MNPELEKAEQQLRLEEQAEKEQAQREADCEVIQSLARAFPLLEDGDAALAREVIRLRRELEELKKQLGVGHAGSDNAGPEEA